MKAKLNNNLPAFVLGKIHIQTTTNKSMEDFVDPEINQVYKIVNNFIQVLINKKTEHRSHSIFFEMGIVNLNPLPFDHCNL